MKKKNYSRVIFFLSLGLVWGAWRLWASAITKEPLPKKDFFVKVRLAVVCPLDICSPRCFYSSSESRLDWFALRAEDFRLFGSKSSVRGYFSFHSFHGSSGYDTSEGAKQCKCSFKWIWYYSWCKVPYGWLELLSLLKKMIVYKTCSQVWVWKQRGGGGNSHFLECLALSQ